MAQVNMENNVSQDIIKNNLINQSLTNNDNPNNGKNSIVSKREQNSTFPFALQQQVKVFLHITFNTMSVVFDGVKIDRD